MLNNNYFRLIANTCFFYEPTFEGYSELFDVARCVASFTSFPPCFCDDCFVDLALSLDFPMYMPCLALLADVHFSLILCP